MTCNQLQATTEPTNEIYAQQRLPSSTVYYLV